MKFVTKTVHKLCSSCISSVENLMKSRTVWSRSGVVWSGAVILQSRRELTTKVRNNLGLSSCAVPRSAAACMVVYFRGMELLPGVQERSGILIRVRIEHVKDINLRTKELGCN